MSRKQRSFTKLRLFLLLILLVFIGVLVWSLKELAIMKQSIQEGWFDTPTKYYTSPLEFKKDQIISTQEVLGLLNKSGLIERGLDQSLGQKQYTLIPFFDCAKRLLPRKINPDTRSCIVIQKTEKETAILEFDNQKIIELTRIENQKSFQTNSILTSPLLFAQWSSEGKPALRTQVSLSQVPRYCIDGVLAIEDDRFLNHQGVSIKGILRAAIVNFKSGKMTQGGSTLTQQLIKNKYLTAEKSLKRKAKEAILAVLIEVLLDKDEILEAYLNYIYWGQRGPYTVFGIEEASKHYFNKSVGSLNLSECTLLAAAIKGPGIYGPHKPKNSKPRQIKVLTRMRELNLITKNEFDEALDQYVKVYNKSDDRLLAPYYINAVQTWLETEIKNKKDREGLSIYTELDFFAQQALEKKFDAFLNTEIAGTKRSKGFQGSYILANNNSNSIIALSSGKSNSLNYNSALFAKRHIGSLAKPFVYLNAFLENDESDEMVITPTTPLNNTSVTYKYDGQTWKPKNYNKKDSEIEYPLFVALAKSKNIPTIQLLKMTGHKSLHKLMLDYGFEAPIPMVPSIALGGFEQSPLNVLRAYVNLSTGNSFKEKPSFVSKIKTAKGDTVYERKFETTINPQKPEERIILEILKNTLKFGTARRAKNLNLKGVYSGKTGTTNDFRDAWFASTSPDYTSVTWVGKANYLEETGRKMTGSGAALPIWMTVTQGLEKAGRYSQDWPVDSDELEFKEVEELDTQIKIPLLFKR